MIELAFFPGARGILMRPHGIGIGFFAGDVVIFGKVIGGLDHAGNHAKAFNRLAHQPAPRQAIIHSDVAHARAAAPLNGVMFNI